MGEENAIGPVDDFYTVESIDGIQDFFLMGIAVCVHADVPNNEFFSGLNDVDGAQIGVMICDALEELGKDAWLVFQTDPHGDAIERSGLFLVVCTHKAGRIRDVVSRFCK